jgi:hypothetical protein
VRAACPGDLATGLRRDRGRAARRCVHATSWSAIGGHASRTNRIAAFLVFGGGASRD